MTLWLGGGGKMIPVTVYPTYLPAGGVGGFGWLVVCVQVVRYGIGGGGCFVVVGVVCVSS